MRYRRYCGVTPARSTLWTVIERFADSIQTGNDADAQAFAKDGMPSLEVGLLAELRAALAGHDIVSELRQDLACLGIKVHAPGSYFWIFVSFGCRYFSWNNAQLQHPVRDIEGAAQRIAIQVRHMSTGLQINSEEK